jgi:hypothetical protein
VEELNKTPLSNKKKLDELTEELIEAVLDKVERRKRLQPKETTEGIRNLLHLISVIPDEIKQMIWLKRLALDYELSEKLLMKELIIIKNKKQRWEERKAKFGNKSKK